MPLKLSGSGGGFVSKGSGEGLKTKIVPQIFSYRYYRMVIKETKYTQGFPGTSFGEGLQFIELEILLNSVRVDYSGASATSNGVLTGGQTPAEAIDNNSSTKWYTSSTPSVGTPTIFNIDFGTERISNAFRYKTGEDVLGRDPVQWTFEGSNNNSTWTILHTQSTNASITDSRSTFTQEFPFS